MKKSDAEPFADAAELAAHAGAQIGVECAERLVEQHELRLGDQRAGQGHALTLAPGDLAVTARFSSPPRPTSAIMARTLASRAFGLALLAAAVAQPEGDVLENVQVREQREILEHEADAAAMRRHALTGPPLSAIVPRSSVSNPAIVRSSTVLPEPLDPSSET